MFGVQWDLTMPVTMPQAILPLQSMTIDDDMLMTELGHINKVMQIMASSSKTQESW